jgi:hypothetical protein
MQPHQYGFIVVKPLVAIAKAECSNQSMRKLPNHTNHTSLADFSTPIGVGFANLVYSPTTGNTFDAFAAAAKFASTSTVPGTNPIGGLRQTTIDVSPGGNLTYFPPNITELVGTEVIYNFNPKVRLHQDRPFQPDMD